MTRSARTRRAGVAGVLAVLAVAVPVGIAAAGGSGGAGGPQPRTVHLTARHSRFSPASVEVPAGTTVRFVIRNLDPIDHELIVGSPEVHERHETGREAHHRGEVPGEITVAAGTTVSTTWTAPRSPTPVTFACHLPGHVAFGMVGVVNVIA